MKLQTRWSNSVGFWLLCSLLLCAGCDGPAAKGQPQEQVAVNAKRTAPAPTDRSGKKPDVAVEVTMRNKEKRELQPGDSLDLPGVRAGTVTLSQALSARRSVREYDRVPLSLADAGELLWAAQGSTNDRGFRTVPSAGATFPLYTYLVAGDVDGLSAGVYIYDPATHRLTMVVAGDIRREVAAAALGQAPVAAAPVSIVLTADYSRTTRRYGQRGHRYVHIEVGHAGQNVCLQATALGLGSVPVGAFHDRDLSALLKLPSEQVPLYLLPVGRIAP